MAVAFAVNVLPQELMAVRVYVEVADTGVHVAVAVTTVLPLASALEDLVVAPQVPPEAVSAAQVKENGAPGPVVSALSVTAPPASQAGMHSKSGHRL